MSPNGQTSHPAAALYVELMCIDIGCTDLRLSRYHHFARSSKAFSKNGKIFFLQVSFNDPA
jgi:hypothetical protein